MRNVRIVGIAGLAALVLACATDDTASARGGGGHGGGHGGSMMGHGGFGGGHGSMMGGGKGGPMMRGFGFAGPNTADALSCRNNKTAAHCRGMAQR